jgi:hypothetical protein
MTTYTVYPQGTVTVVVPASESIAVFTTGNTSANVYELLNYPQFPSSWDLIGVVANQEAVFGPFTLETRIRIDANADSVLYAVGATPAVSMRQPDVVSNQPVPNAQTTTITLTIDNLLTKIITGTHSAGATQTYTLPTGTLTDAGVQFNVGDSFDWALINLSAAAINTITVAPGTGHTLVGGAVVQSANATTGELYGSSGMFRTKKTATNTYVTYRIA